MAMDFGGAIHAMKGGKKVAREGWARGVWLMIQFPDDHSKMTHPYVYEHDDTDSQEPWIPQHEDMLSEDWQIVEE
jgi:hypothetical protein